MDKKINNELTKENEEAFFREVDKWTELFHLEIYNAFRYDYENTVLNEEYSIGKDPNYYYAYWVLYHTSYIYWHAINPYRKCDDNILTLAKTLNEKNDKHPYFFFFNFHDNTFHPINCTKLSELFDNDKEQYNIDLDYSYTNENDKRYFKARIKKEDFIRLIGEEKTTTNKK